MVSATRTLGPLHFEDLEPKRFEDLTRQLVYNFKNWRRLEATGRSGSDYGFDARGFEIVGAGAVSASEADEEEVAVSGVGDRLWLIQCKRERAIGPTKLLKYLDEIRLADGEHLHGIVFAAACDFSKTARDRFRDRCVAMGLQEWHLWGKAEIEDQLFRPEHDGLLFAYFGVSLAIRQRSQRADLRAKLAMKRKAKRLLEPKENFSVLLRSPDAFEYPDDRSIPDFNRHPQWLVRTYRGLGLKGLGIVVRRHFAYLDDDGESWDAMFCCNEAIELHDDYWKPPTGQRDATREEARRVWLEIPDRNRAWLDVIGIVPFEDVLDIDEIGDACFDGPHIYVPFDGKNGPFSHFRASVETVSAYDTRQSLPEDTDRVEKFPAHLRERSAAQATGSA